MKLTLDLASESKQEWIDAVMADFNSFLQDHADCERKASAMAMSFVAKYPDRKEIIFVKHRKHGNKATDD